MPSENNKSTKEKYLDTLAVIRVAILKYRSSHLILLVGNFNIDPFKEIYERDVWRVKLLELTAELGFKLISNGTDPTMFAHNGKHTSHIHLLFGNETSHIKHGDMKIDEWCHGQHTCHVPGGITLKHDIWWTVETPKKTPSKDIKLITKWHTLNKDMYGHCKSGYLQLMDLQMLYMDPAVEIISLIIRQAILQATGVHINRGETKRRNTWAPDIVQALERAYQYHAMWKQEVRPGPQSRWAQVSAGSTRLRH